MFIIVLNPVDDGGVSLKLCNKSLQSFLQSSLHHLDYSHGSE